jgi:hypothetical protein
MTNLSLTVNFASLAALTAFVTKMGADVQGATITHNQELTADETPAAATPAPVAGGKGGKKNKKDKETASAEIPAIPTPAVQTNPTGTPFPGAPLNFAPGAPAAQPAPQPAPQPVAVTPASAPSVAPMVATQAPAPAPVSAERQQYNQACAELIGTMEKLGPNYEKSAQELLNWCFAQVQAQVPKVSLLTDQQVTAFYQHLHGGVTQLVEHYNANAPK